MSGELPARSVLLGTAEKLVCSDRNLEYGEPADNLKRWAESCNALGYRGPGGRQLLPHDIAVIMCLGKLARTVVSYQKDDTWADIAGYAAIGWECVSMEGKQE
jgi:Domain of unknown function (DUF6378)